MCDFWTYIRETAIPNSKSWHHHNELLDMMYTEIAYLVCSGFERVTITSTQLVRYKDGTATPDENINVAWHNKLCEDARAKGDEECVTIREAFRLIIQHDDLIHSHLQVIEDTEELSSYRVLHNVG